MKLEGLLNLAIAVGAFIALIIGIYQIIFIVLKACQQSHLIPYI